MRKSTTAGSSIGGLVSGVATIVVTPPGGGRRARGGDRLAMLGAGLADEDTHVDEARRNDVARTIDDPGLRRQLVAGDRRPSPAMTPSMTSTPPRVSGGGIDKARVDEGEGAVVGHKGSDKLGSDSLRAGRVQPYLLFQIEF